MSLLKFKKQCPHCDRPIVMNCDVSRLHLKKSSWNCPKCKERFLFKDLSYTEHELLSVLVQQSIHTNERLVKQTRLQSVGNFSLLVLSVIAMILFCAAGGSF